MHCDIYIYIYIYYIYIYIYIYIYNSYVVVKRRRRGELKNKYQTKHDMCSDGTPATDLGNPKDHSCRPTDPQVTTTWSSPKEAEKNKIRVHYC